MQGPDSLPNKDRSFALSCTNIQLLVRLVPTEELHFFQNINFKWGKHGTLWDCFPISTLDLGILSPGDKELLSRLGQREALL